MAVEARHPNLLQTQLIGHREMMNPIEGNANLYNIQMGYGVPLSGTITTETLLPAYNSFINDSVPSKTAKKSDSGLTYYIPTLPRKRTRDSLHTYLNYPTPPTNKNCSTFSFLGEDISLQIQQQQFDVDRLISQHMENVRLEIEEKRKRQARKILEAIEMGMMKSLKAKEEEIEKIVKLNWALEEKVKSLFLENQLWRDLAENNEATANALRSNLEQVLSQVRVDRNCGQTLVDDDAPCTNLLMDDAQSCCGSTGDVMLGMHMNDVDEGTSIRSGNKNKNKNSCSSRMCRNCGKEESSVLLLPCRHLCLCTVCGSSLHTCPVCKSMKNASVHVNMC